MCLKRSNYIFRLLWTIAYIVLIGNTQNLIHTNEVVNISIYYYILLGFVFLINEVSRQLI